MKYQYSIIDKILLGSMCLACLASYLLILVQPQHSLSEKFIFSGIWIIISFIIITGIVGAIHGIPKTDVRVHKKSAIICFSFAAILFLVGAIINGGI